MLRNALRLMFVAAGLAACGAQAQVTDKQQVELELALLPDRPGNPWQHLSDSLEVIAAQGLASRWEQLKAMHGWLAGQRRAYVEVAAPAYPGLRQFDLAACKDQAVVVNADARGCNTPTQFFAPAGRQDLIFQCFRPFTTDDGKMLDRWCTAEAEIAPRLVVRYSFQRSLLADGAWAEMDRGVRELLREMLAGE